MEQIPLRPFAEKAVHTAVNVGKFVVERFQGGAWADVTKPANIQVKEAQIIKGEN